MKKVLIINAHEYYPLSEGKLNAAMTEKARAILSAKGYDIKITTMKDEYDVQEELE